MGLRGGGLAQFRAFTVRLENPLGMALRRLQIGCNGAQHLLGMVAQAD
ncbi:hypothetical protein WLF18_19175 [Pseudomonas shirazensis]|uniref:Uncharacterized protein n=1 Tax=Pseudomonas shirazensis TaxID=2745494 RepID=A0ABU9A3R8_9PSED